jgi:hypothetical protein
MDSNLKAMLKKALDESKPRVVLTKGFPFNNHLQIIETRPLFRTVKMVDYEKIEGCGCDECRRCGEERLLTFTFAMPYMQFYHNPKARYESQRIRVTWSLNPLEHHEQQVGIPLLPNVYYFPHIGSMCMGRVRIDNAFKLCHYFWNTVFTPFDYKWYYRKTNSDGKTTLEVSTLRSFAHWCELSKKTNDPMEVFKGFEHPTLVDYHSLMNVKEV